MSTRRNFVIGSAALAVSPVPMLRAATTSSMDPTPGHQELWFSKPAARWMEALPIGNGRIGGMVHGGVAVERIDLTESTVWSGAPSNDNIRPGAHEHLGEIQQLMFAGKYAEGGELCKEYILGKPASFGTHLPMASLEIAFAQAGEVHDYRRSLDLDEAIANVSYMQNDLRFEREVFSSNPDQVLVVRIACNKPRSLSCGIRFAQPILPGKVTTSGTDTLILRGQALERLHSNGQQGVSFESRVRVVASGGHVVAVDGGVQVSDADSLLILVAIATDFRGWTVRSEQRLQSLLGKSFAEIRASHVRDHQRLFRRTQLDLGDPHIAAQKPTDERRKAVAAGADDPALAALFFQYGRYLTIAGSRSNSPLPLALQGIWNDGLASSMGWTDDFHLDINTQQNYWLAEVGNLSECQQPLFDFLEHLSAAGRATAQTLYGAPGWVAHVVTNPWGFTAPGWGLGWGIFPTGGVWLALQMWEHYRFTVDKQFLQERLYPVFKEAVVFFLAYMVKEPQHGWLVTGPAVSPENSFIAPDGRHYSESMGPTCDRVLVFALLSACIEASAALGIDEAFRTRAQGALRNLPPLQIGKHGQVQEWLHDFEEADPGHRHTSHLIALYPEHQISPADTPELAAAARVTIERRISQPTWEDSEWVRANLVNYYARLLDGEAAHKQLVALMANASEDSLLTYSRGGVAGAESNIFSLDGNTAGAAGIAEMLLQSQAGEMHLLPALPSAWPNGHIAGLCARGAVEVSVDWHEGRLTSASFKSRIGGTHIVRYGQKKIEVHIGRGREVRINSASFDRA